MTHIRFEGEEGDEDMMETAEQSVNAHPQELRKPHCCAAARVDFNQGIYVFRCSANTPACTAIAASTSAGVVKLYTLSSGAQLTHITDLRGHGGTISDLRFTHAQTGDTNLLHTSCSDGIVRAWDIRTPMQPVASYSAPGQSLTCMDVREHVVAAGGQGEVIFWDRRATAGAGGGGGKELGRLDDTHMEEVTQVRFHMGGTSAVFSSSIDGLVAVHDTSKALDSDDAFLAAINMETSIEELGLYGRQEERLWLRTGTEGLALWEWGRAATGDDTEGGEAPFAVLQDARESAAQASPGASSTTDEEGNTKTTCSLFPEGLSYLVGCHWDAPSQQLLLLAGHEGSVGWWPVVEEAGPAGPLTGARLQPPAMLLSGGHTGVVRTVQCFGDATRPGTAFCVSGGEDARVCLWSLDPNLTAVGAAAGGQHGKHHQRQQGSQQQHSKRKRKQKGKQPGNGPHQSNQGEDGDDDDGEGTEEHLQGSTGDYDGMEEDEGPGPVRKHSKHGKQHQQAGHSSGHGSGKHWHKGGQGRGQGQGGGGGGGRGRGRGDGGKQGQRVAPY